MADGVKMRSSMRVRGVLERWFAVAIVRVACGASVVSAVPGYMFTSRATLDVAISVCLADDPTGGCICANIAGGCGEAGISNLPQWDVRGIDDFSSLFQDEGNFDQNLDGWVALLENMYGPPCAATTRAPHATPTIATANPRSSTPRTRIDDRIFTPSVIVAQL